MVARTQLQAASDALLTARRLAAAAAPQLPLTVSVSPLLCHFATFEMSLTK